MSINLLLVLFLWRALTDPGANKIPAVLPHTIRSGMKPEGGFTAFPPGEGIEGAAGKNEKKVGVMMRAVTDSDKSEGARVPW